MNFKERKCIATTERKINVVRPPLVPNRQFWTLRRARKRKDQSDSLRLPKRNCEKLTFEGNTEEFLQPKYGMTNTRWLYISLSKSRSILRSCPELLSGSEKLHPFFFGMHQEGGVTTTTKNLTTEGNRGRRRNKSFPTTPYD